MNRKQTSYQKYTQHQMHELLCNKLLSEEYKRGVYQTDTEKQALFCPYYVKLQGLLGLDWGVIVNPESPKFGQLVFEHDGCGCANHNQQAGNQLSTSWLLPKRT